MLFARKAEVKSADYEALLKKILEVKHEIESVKAKCDKLETNYDDLRGKFNRKLYKMTPDEEEASKPLKKGQETQILNTFNPFK
jgi:predicted transcriptional regulator